MSIKLTSPLTAASAARVNGRYELRRALGRGASATVFECVDLQCGEARALKLLHQQSDEKLLRSEFTRLSRWSHPHLPRVHDLDRLRAPVRLGSGRGLAAGRLFLVEDLLRGEDPLERLAKTPPAERDPLLRRIAADLCRALAFLHGHRVLHRDLKPENLLLAADDGRAVLLDLGLATGSGAGGARGTLLYLAPEALGGGADFRSDLWSLGATLFHLAEGRPPFKGSGTQLVRRILEETPGLTVGWLSTDLRELILSLLRKDPLRRPASARSVLAELARSAGDHRTVAELSSRAELLAPALAGRQQLLERLREELRGGAAVVLLAGAPGSGKTRLVEEALRWQRLQAAAGRAEPVEVLAGGLRQVAARLPALEVGPALASWTRGEEAALSLDELALELADLLGTLQPEVRLIVHLAEADAEPLAARLLQALCAQPRRAGKRVQLLAEVSPEAGRRLIGPGGALLELEPLQREEVTSLIVSMLGGPAPEELCAELYELSQGNPALLTELVRQWHDEGSGGLLLERVELQPLIERARARLPKELRAVMDALAVWGEPAGTEELCALLDEEEPELWPRLEALAHRGSLVLEDARARFPSPAHASAWARALGSGAAALHARAAALLGPDGPSARLARHLLEAGLPGGPEVALRAARELARVHQPLAAIALLERVVGGALAKSARPLLAELYLQTGRYAEALQLLDEDDPAEALLRAQVLQRSGDYAGAEALLGGLLGKLAEGDERLQASATLGRVMLQGGRAADAWRSLGPAVERVLAAPEDAELSAAASSCLEVAGLARYYQGELAEADRLFARGERALQHGAPARLARFINFRGMVAFAAGELPLAAAHYRRALELAARVDAHGRATYLANLGSTLLLTGRYGEALEHLTAALRDLERLARNTEVAATYCNLANLLLALGDLDQAGAVCRRGIELATRLGSLHATAHLRMLQGDLARRGGRPREALARYLEASSLFDESGAARERFLCELARAEALAEAGEPGPARALLSGLRAAADQDGPLALSWARVCHAGEERVPEETERALVGYCAELERRGAAPELWRAAALLGRLLRSRRRTGPARRALRRARATWEVIVSQAPDLYRERMNEDPEARSLAASWEALLEEGGEPAEGASASSQGELLLDAGRLRRLLAINKRLNSELRLPRLLELIMDTVIELTGAERGFLLLVEAEDRLSIKVARNIDQQSLDGEELSLSRSIAERAARSGLPVVTVDAATDGRWKEALSVSDLNLRSVLALPLRVKGQTVGVVYIDSRLRQGLFGEAEVRLVQDLADQAAIAIDNARLLSENRRRQREIERLNQKLRKKVQTQQAELDEVREELRSSREALQPHRDYHGIVGRSPRMRELFHLLDRVVETELPVVIQGESGTGKELVARAVHRNGRRASRPFVSENCAAIPETLLESVLFGHVRGAFTGADRDRKGLFEVASGGTLFLDEVGEMSPAMQTKLLRVLQDGELRRVGGTQTLRTDVRVIAASNKDLVRLVAEGRFREDLFYRLNVINIVVPPLRERREDIPLLVDHFLARHAMGEGRRVSPEAMALLVGHAWPGNVRELENEVLRAGAMAGAVIQPKDLSPGLAGGVPLSVVGADEMNLKLRVEHLERELLRKALDLAGGNHTQAAQRLGLSRFGLLKKLKRYGEGQ